MKCCANCEWNISPELEEEILREQRYDETDPNRPHAGDCCIGMKHNETYYCKYHQYLQGYEEYENIVLYDDKCFGPGYYIITKLDDEIIKYMKISIIQESGFPFFQIIGFEKNSVDKPDESFRKIQFTVEKNDPLYKIIGNLAKNTNNQKIYSIDQTFQGKNNLSAKCDIEESFLILEKDIYGVKYETDSINILLGDNDSCKNYKAISNFYNELSSISLRKAKENEIKRLLFKNK